MTLFIIKSDSCASGDRKICKITVAVLQGTTYKGYKLTLMYMVTPEHFMIHHNTPFYSLGCVVSCAKMLVSPENFFKQKYVSQMVSREIANVILQTFSDAKPSDQTWGRNTWYSCTRVLMYSSTFLKYSYSYS